MTQEEFDRFYPEGSLIRQEKIRELEAAEVSEPVVQEPETPANPAGGSTIPEEIWRRAV